MKKRLRTKPCGYILPLALLAVIVLLITGAGLLSLGMNSRLFAIRTTSQLTARCAADAGLTQALFEMNEKLEVKPWDDSTLPAQTETSAPGCDAVFSYEVTADSGVYTVQSTGTYNQARKTVICTLRLQSPFESAVFTTGPITLNNSARVDWYNYDADDSVLQIATNKTGDNSITLKNTAVINGDAAVGVGGDPESDIELNGSATIEGQTTALAEEYEFQPVLLPEWLSSLPSSGSITGNTTLVSSAQYSSINLKKNKKITIDGDVTLYVTGDVVLGNSTELQITETGSLTLYLGGNLEAKTTSSINNETEDPSKLQIHGLDSCEKIEFKNSSDVYGVVYAPDAEVTMHNSVTLYGAVVSNQLDMKNSSTLMYDASLRDAEADDAYVRFITTNWREQ